MDIDIDSTQEKIRKLRPKEYQNFVSTLEFLEHDAANRNILTDWTLTQMSVKQGIKLHGTKGKESVMKEIHNLVDRDCFGEVAYKTLSREDRKYALVILMFMNLKQNGVLKTQGCADGRPQRLWTKKHEVSSPTPANESLRYILATIAFERRDAASFDLPGQFLQTEMDQILYLKIMGAIAMLLAESNPTRWKKYLRIEHGRPVIYVKCNKAIYGTLNAAILAYKKLTGYFKKWGFTMNPYDPCVWNKMINGSQMTVIFHVDDGIVSHVDPKQVTDFLKELSKIYGQTDPLTIRRGKIHDYLGMTIDFSIDLQVMVTMYDYIMKLIAKLPKDMIGERATAAPEYLFKTSDGGAVLLSQEEAEFFHSIVATTLYLSQRTRVDLQLAVGFLCTRVKKPDEHDQKKLTHLMKYIQRTAHLPLILRSNGNGTVIYIDGAHSVHADMKGHAGVYATEGSGAMYRAGPVLSGL